MIRPGKSISDPASEEVAASQAPVCVRCRQRITVDPALSRDALEGMHWLCFHLEYEHDTDPDTRCSDYTGCPWWTIKYLEDRLRALGEDPDGVIEAGMRKEGKW
jgi:hypothetical protein